MGKTNYLMEKEWNALFKSLPSDQAGELIKAICAFTDGEEYKIENPLLSSVCEMMKAKITENDTVYEKSCNRRNIGNLKRWHPELYALVAEDADEMALFLNDPYGYIRTHKETEGDGRNPDTDATVSVTVPVPDNDTEKENTSYSSSVQRVAEKWNSLSDIGVKQINSVSGNRKILLEARIKEHGVEAVEAAIERIRGSTFLRGGGKKGWSITFDWFIKPNNFPKVAEGNYDDPKGGADSGRGDLPTEGWGKDYDPYKEFRDNWHGTASTVVSDDGFERLVIDD